MKTKILATTALAMTVLTVALLWLMDGKLQDERKISSEAGLRGPVIALSQTLATDLRGLKRALPADGDARIDWDAFRPFIALARFRGSESLSVDQYLHNGLWPASDWTTATASEVLARAPKGEGVFGFIASLANQRKILTVVVREGERGWAAFAPPEAWQAILDLQKGPRGWIAVLNRSGQIVAHSTAEYLGTSGGSESLTDQVRAADAERDFRAFEVPGGPSSLMAFEKIPGTDLIVAAARPLSEIRAERRKVWIFGGLAGVGIVLFAASLVWTLLSRWEEEQVRAVAAARAAAAAATKVIKPENVEKPQKVEKGEPALDRKESFARIASALGSELRSPLLSVLGHTQTLLGGDVDERLKGPAESILRETRFMRDVVDKMLAFAGDVPGEKKETPPDQVLARVLKDLEPKFAQKHVKVTKDLRETSPLPMVPAALEKAVRHVLDNAVEAMERQGKKEITVRLSEDPESIRLEISDTGEGIPESNRARVTDPFFTTRLSAQHLGMGLPAALGVARELGGDLKIESQSGKGTTVTFVLPKPKKTVEIAGESVKLTTEEVVQIPESLPPAEPPPIVAGAAPIEVDIEDLFALPPESPFIEDDKTPVTTSTVPFDDDKTNPTISTTGIEVMAAAPPIPPPQNPPPPPTVATKVAGGVEAPRFKAPERTSALDSFRVEIRRPGARP